MFNIYVQEETVVTMTLKSDFHMVLGHEMNGPTEYSVDPFLSTCAPKRATCGDDGLRLRVWQSRFSLFPDMSVYLRCLILVQMGVNE